MRRALALARLLVDQPDQVEVQEIPSRRGGGVLELKVAPDDLGATPQLRLGQQ